MVAVVVVRGLVVVTAVLDRVVWGFLGVAWKRERRSLCICFGWVYIVYGRG
jgi:hypothetical protein